jgi:putative polyketide hydroxylase
MRAPHLAVDRDGSQLSLLDHFGDGFVLLAGESGDRWSDVAGRLDVPVTTYRHGVDFHDASGRFAGLYDVGADGAALVRPDGFVTWRTRSGPDGREQELATALRAALGR